MRRVLLCVLLLMGTVATNAEELDSIRNYKVDEVVVTATRSPLMLKHTPVITRVINAVDIKRQGMPTLQNLLERELAGVEFHQAGYGSSLSFQGLDARYVLFMIDGERMAGETYGNIDYARIPMSNIERIEIVRGASSVLYGSNAMGAVVNIITRMPRERFEVNFTSRYGTRFQSNGSEPLPKDAPKSDLKKYRNKIDLPNIDEHLSVGFNRGRFSSLTSASLRMVDAYKLVGTENEKRVYKSYRELAPKMIPIPGGGMRPEMDPATGMPVFVATEHPEGMTLDAAPDTSGLSISGWRDFNISQKFDYKLSEKFRFELYGSYFNKNRYDFYNNIMNENPMAAMDTYKKRPWTYETYEGYTIKAVMEHSPNMHNKIYLSFIRDEYFRNEKTISSDVTPKQRHTYNTPRLLWTLNAGKWNRLTTGLEMVNEQLEFDLNLKKKLEYQSMNTASFFIQDEMLSERTLSFVVGFRGDYNDKFGWNATPKASAKLALGDFSVRANYSMGYRTPSLKEMYMTFKVPIFGNTFIRGNDKLKPETNNYISLSGEYLTQKWNFSATIYKSYFRNKIDVRATAGDDGSTIMKYSNVNRSELSGVELLMRVHPVENLVFKANYNYIHTTDDAPQESTQYIYPSPHTVTLNIDYGFDTKIGYLGLSAAMRYVGAKDYQDFMTYMSYKPGASMPSKIIMGNYSAHHEGYTVCNAAVNLEMTKIVAMTLGVDNIFDYRPKVVNFNAAINPRRNFFAKVALSF